MGLSGAENARGLQKSLQLNYTFAVRGITVTSAGFGALGLLTKQFEQDIMGRRPFDLT